MKEQSEQLAALSAENQRLTSQLAAAKRVPALSPEQESELLQLRGVAFFPRAAFPISTKADAPTRSP